MHPTANLAAVFSSAPSNHECFDELPGNSPISVTPPALTLPKACVDGNFLVEIDTGFTVPNVFEVGLKGSLSGAALAACYRATGISYEHSIRPDVESTTRTTVRSTLAERYPLPRLGLSHSKRGCLCDKARTPGDAVGGDRLVRL